jgi:multiple sugar transport system permease protein
MLRKILLVIIFILLLLPMWYLFTGSFQEIKGIFRMPPDIIPRNITLNNYEWLFSLSNLGIWAINTIIVSIITVILSILVSASSGYVFAMYNFRIKKVLWLLFMASIMLPRISTIIPLFVVTNKIGISGTIFSVILPSVFSATSIYLARNYFEGIPKAFIESAKIDGCGDFNILFKIVMPISQPIITAIALFSAIGSLGDYIWQQLQLQRNETITLLVGLIRAVGVRNDPAVAVNPLGRALAVSCFLLVPLLVLFLIANKYFVEGLSSGAIKE